MVYTIKCDVFEFVNFIFLRNLKYNDVFFKFKFNKRTNTHILSFFNFKQFKYRNIINVKISNI